MSTTPQMPFAPEDALTAAETLRALQSAGPVHRVLTAVGDPAWLVTGYAEVRQLLTDDRLGRSHPDPPSAARTGESALFGGPLGDYGTEHADHARMRSLLAPHFSPGRIRALRPRVEQLAAELVEDLAGQDTPVDLVPAIAEPLPILVICELLGVPYDDRPQFRAWSRAAGDIRDRQRSEQGLADLFGYGQQLVARKRERPGDDVISRLCAVDDVGDDEAAMLAMGLLFAGHETTVVQIGLAVLMLLADPARWHELHEDPDLVPAAVEETLRACGKGGGGIPRYAHVDLTVAGTDVRAGELVLLDNGAANHDAAVFPDPDRFDPHRRDSGHLTFGHGARYCIGAPLARLELQAVLGLLIERFPSMRLARPVEELRMHDGQLTGGLVELPVTW